MADIGQFKKEFISFTSTFKTTSFDSENSTSLCYDETQEVLDFDAIVEDLYPNSNERPKSFDALYVYKNLLFCIEFKNQKPSQIDNAEVQGKLEKGKKELVRLLQDRNIQKNSYNFVYCVVYKKCIEPRDRYKCGIEKGKIQFGLEKYEQNGFVKRVYTENVDFFTKQFKKQFQKELMC